MKRMVNIKLCVAVAALLVSFAVDAVTVKRISRGAFNDAVVATPTLYIIEGDCMLTHDVALADGSVLKFEGGQINGKGTIKGNRIMIDAPRYRIFGDNVKINGIANGEVSAHWWGAVGDGIAYDCGAIKRALRDAASSWVVLDNLKYLTNETIVLGRAQKLRCDGTLSYRGIGAAIELTDTDIEVDIRELRQNAGTGFEQSAAFKASAVLFTGNVYNANVNIDRIMYFNRAFDLSPKHSRQSADHFRGIQYCKISWQFIAGEYGIYIDMVSGMILDGVARRTWVNENQFNGGRLLCRQGIYSTPVDDRYRDRIGVINGNVFNCIGFEGEGKVKCKAITLHNAWHNNFTNIRLSEGYVPVGSTWIELTQCGYLSFDFKSQIPYSAVKATRCNHIEISANFTDNGMGYFLGYDRMYILNENGAYNPLNNNPLDKNSQNVKLLTRSASATSEVKHIYVGATTAGARGGVVKTVNFNDLFFSGTGDMKVFSDKSFITVNDNSTLNISTDHSLANANLGLELVCKISAGSKVVIANAKGQKITLTESGVYQIKPVGAAFELFKIGESGSRIISFK